MLHSVVIAQLASKRTNSVKKSTGSELTKVIGCPPVKRGRGRPRTNTLVVQTSIKNDSANVIECLPMKRGRGRPRGSGSKCKSVIEEVKSIPAVVGAELFGGRFRNNFVQRE